MVCPRCQSPLETRERDGIRSSSCPACGGNWFGGAALHALFARGGDTRHLEEALESFHDVDFRTSRRHCPSCRGKSLKAVMVDDIELDYCVSCKGLFFDPGEMEQVFPDGVASSAADPDSGIGSQFWAAIVKFTGSGH